MFTMTIHKARTIIIDPLFFIAQKKKSHVKSQPKIARLNAAELKSCLFEEDGSTNNFMSICLEN